jgi:hypothetical protein
MKIEMGANYKDRITGFTGTAIGHVEYLTGCNQTLLAPTTEDPSKLPESYWMDDQRLHRIGTEAIKLDNGSNPGCAKQPPIL